jgi:hypothetical protein
MMGLPAEGMDEVIIRVFYLKVKAGKKRALDAKMGGANPPLSFCPNTKKEFMRSPAATPPSSYDCGVSLSTFSPLKNTET